MLQDDRIRLRHMLDASNDAMQFITGYDRDDLQNNRMLLFALVQCLEIIGEAATGVSESTRELAPHIPWRNIVAMRNRLIHGYYDINTDIVWNTVQIELPQLIKRLEEILAE